jgi:hypothetical protein
MQQRPPCRLTIIARNVHLGSALSHHNSAERKPWICFIARIAPTEEEVMASAAMASWREEDPEVSYVLIDRSIDISLLRFQHWRSVGANLGRGPPMFLAKKLLTPMHPWSSPSEHIGQPAMLSSRLSPTLFSLDRIDCLL